MRARSTSISGAVITQASTPQSTLRVAPSSSTSAVSLERPAVARAPEGWRKNPIMGSPSGGAMGSAAATGTERGGHTTSPVGTEVPRRADSTAASMIATARTPSSPGARSQRRPVEAAVDQHARRPLAGVQALTGRHRELMGGREAAGRVAAVDAVGIGELVLAVVVRPGARDLVREVERHDRGVGLEEDAHRRAHTPRHAPVARRSSPGCRPRTRPRARRRCRSRSRAGRGARRPRSASSAAARARARAGARSARTGSRRPGRRRPTCPATPRRCSRRPRRRRSPPCPRTAPRAPSPSARSGGGDGRARPTRRDRSPRSTSAGSCSHGRRSACGPALARRRSAACASSSVTVMGFSISTWQPASSAAIACSRCIEWPEATMMPSQPAASSSSTSVDATSRPKPRWSAASASSLRRTTPTQTASGASRRYGR